MAGFRGHKHNMSHQMPIEGSNFELNAHMSGLAVGSELAYRDILKKNMGDVKSFRLGKMQSGKEQIEYVHSDLKRRKGLAEELLNLHALPSHLPKHSREAFLNIHKQGPLLGHLHTLNACFIPVLDYLILYKSEIGLTL